MISHPIFKPHLTAQVLPGEGVLLLSEAGSRALHGRVYELIAPLLDGRRSTDAIVDALADRLSGAEVYYGLMQLEKNGHLVEHNAAIPPETAAFWEGLGVSASTAQRLLREQRIGLNVVGAADAVPLQAALEALGIRMAENDTAPDLILVVTDDYQRRGLEAINADHVVSGRPWLLVRLNGHEPWIGPLYRGRDTGCHACLLKRLQRHQAVQRFAARKLGLDEAPALARAALGASQRMAAELAALEVAKFLAGAPAQIDGKVLSIDSYQGQMTQHRLLKDPYCPVCGTQPAPRRQPVAPQPRKVSFVQDGGHRSTAPERTLRTYEHLVSPITGVVSHLAAVREAQGIAHVFVAGHNHALKLDHLDHLKQGLRNASAGKGVSEAQAKASALCEAIERYSGERQGDEVVETASYAAMCQKYGDAVIHPNAVMGYSDKQLAEHAAWNARKSKFNRVPEPLDEQVPIDWTPVWSLSEQRHKYLPTQLLYYQSKAGPDCDKFYAMGCSNGNASGNNLEEAVLQGFFELVERDAVALWWYNRLRQPGVALETFGEPYLADLCAYYDGLGRDCWALDITSDLGIPAFVAISRLRAGMQDRMLFGLGCHLDARIAVQRAFAEMNQMLGMAEADDEGGKLRVEDAETLHWLTTATLQNQPYMAADPAQRPSTLQDYPKRYSGDLLDDIALCRQIIESRGMEMLVLDQTRADVGMPVAKVIVPGLRHFWARHGAGRLYDVPVAMGWLAKPLSEDELNPIPIFF